MNVVWFKRDLRIEDHLPLKFASELGPTIPLYIIESELWQQPDMSERHYQFLQTCLVELNDALELRGQKLIIKVGNAIDVLTKLRHQHNIQNLFSHQETWNKWTYQRDTDVQNWCLTNGVKWQEYSQNGVIRRLKYREGWAKRWYQLMKQPIIETPNQLSSILESSDSLPSFSEISEQTDSYNQIQRGGRREGVQLLHSFLNERGEAYTKEMSSPVTAFDSCSRLSAHIAFGTLSVREVFQACELRSQELKQMPRSFKGKWPSAMKSFSGRLRWHCHFIQKLEDEL